MKKISAPDGTTASTLLNTVISRKKNKDYVDSLNKNKSYVLSRYKIYNANKERLEKVGASSITTDIDKAAIHTSFNSTFKKDVKNKELKKVYEGCQGICPYCGEGKIEEVDHYIPKEDYPEFTLYPYNLIPICNKCNKKKSGKFLDEIGNRQFINYYYDEIDDLDFVRVQIKYDKDNIQKTIKIKYIADYNKITNKYLLEIIKSHYTNLKLLSRFEDAASNEVSELITTLISQSERNECKIRDWIQMTIEGKKNKQLSIYGKNDWKYLLYNELYNTNFMDDLIHYICGK